MAKRRKWKAAGSRSGEPVGGVKPASRISAKDWKLPKTDAYGRTPSDPALIQRSDRYKGVAAEMNDDALDRYVEGTPFTRPGYGTTEGEVLGWKPVPLDGKGEPVRYCQNMDCGAELDPKARHTCLTPSDVAQNVEAVRKDRERQVELAAKTRAERRKRHGLR